MKRFLFSLILLAALASGLKADYLYNPHRLAVVGGTRPTLAGVNAAGLSTTQQKTRTVSITPPVGTSLLVAYASISDGTSCTSPSSNESIATFTLGGVALGVGTPYTVFDCSLADAFAYKLNPTTGVAQNLTITALDDWATSFIYVWFFSGTDPADPFGFAQVSQSVNASGRTITFQPEYTKPYIIAGSASHRGSGSGNCYTGTNLTIALQDADGGDDNAAAVASNSSLTSAGSTSFTLTCNWETGPVSMDILEIKGP